MKQRRAMAVLAASCSFACGKSDHDARKAPAPASTPTRPASAIEIPAGLSSTQRTAAEQARDAFMAACASTPIDWRIFKEVSLTTSTASGYLKDKFDWELMATVALVYKDDVDERRGGHRITFDIGAGSRPGIVTRKSQGIQLCAFSGRAHGVTSGNPAMRTPERTAS